MTQVRQSAAGTFVPPESRLYRAHRAWVLFVQGLFASRDVGDYRWSSDPTESEIVITSVQPTDKTAQHKRPIIVVARGSARTLGATRDQKTEINLMAGTTTFTRLYSFDIRIMAVAREGVEADNLLWFVDEMILPFKPALQRVGAMHHIDNRTAFSEETQHGMIVPGSSVPEWRSVTLVVPCSVQSLVSRESTDERFQAVVRSVTLQLNTDG